MCSTASTDDFGGRPGGRPGTAAAACGQSIVLPIDKQMIKAAGLIDRHHWNRVYTEHSSNSSHHTECAELLAKNKGGGLVSQGTGAKCNVSFSPCLTE